MRAGVETNRPPCESVGRRVAIHRHALDPHGASCAPPPLEHDRRNRLPDFDQALRAILAHRDRTARSHAGCKRTLGLEPPPVPDEHLRALVGGDALEFGRVLRSTRRRYEQNRAREGETHERRHRHSSFQRLMCVTGSTTKGTAQPSRAGSFGVETAFEAPRELVAARADAGDAAGGSERDGGPSSTLLSVVLLSVVLPLGEAAGSVGTAGDDWVAGGTSGDRLELPWRTRTTATLRSTAAAAPNAAAARLRRAP